MDRYRYPISVDSAVFGYKRGGLQITLIKRNKEPFKGMWAIPGGFMEGDETVEETAYRELKEETGISDVYLEQFHVFSKRGRDPRGPTITVALFALVNSEQYELIATADAEMAKWWPIYALPPLAFDHEEICTKALKALRIAFKTGPIAFELLPKNFTLSELQDLYEQTFNTKIDKRNFRKKVLKMDLIRTTGAKTQGGRQRPAELYTFDSTGFAQEKIF